MAKDFLRQELHVGDSVVFSQKNYRNFMFGTITKITPRTVLISHERTNVGGTETRQDHGQVIKVNSDNSLVAGGLIALQQEITELREELRKKQDITPPASAFYNR